MDIIDKLFSKAITTKVQTEIEKKPSILKMIAATPDNFKLEAWVENDEFIIKVKKKGES